MVNDTFHDRVLDMSERLVREHPYGRELLALVLDPDSLGLCEVILDDATATTAPTAVGRREDHTAITLQLDDGDATAT